MTWHYLSSARSLGGGVLQLVDAAYLRTVSCHSSWSTVLASKTGYSKQCNPLRFALTAFRTLPFPGAAFSPKSLWLAAGCGTADSWSVSALYPPSGKRHFPQSYQILTHAHMHAHTCMQTHTNTHTLPRSTTPVSSTDLLNLEDKAVTP